MAAPVISGIAFDKPVYTKGVDTVTATVTYTPGTSPQASTFQVTGTDTVSGLAATLSAVFQVMQPDATTFAPSDSGKRAWTQVSDNGSQAIFTAAA